MKFSSFKRIFSKAEKILFYTADGYCYLSDGYILLKFPIERKQDFLKPLGMEGCTYDYFIKTKDGVQPEQMGDSLKTLMDKAAKSSIPAEKTNILVAQAGRNLRLFQVGMDEDKKLLAVDNDRAAVLEEAISSGEYFYTKAASLLYCQGDSIWGMVAPVIPNISVFGEYFSIPIIVRSEE